MLKIGITGGIGSGKSTVCKIFQQLGIAIYDADKEAKLLYDNDGELKQEVIRLFGDAMYSNNKFMPAVLASIVFSAPEKLMQLNALVHPRVKEHFNRWCSLQTGAYSIKEAALLLESGSYQQLDQLILVSCPMEVRMHRVLHRDKLNREAINQRMQKQWSDEQKRPYCSFEIYNDGTQLLIPQVIQIDKKLRSIL